jgi:hypothetical protein
MKEANSTDYTHSLSSCKRTRFLRAPSRLTIVPKGTTAATFFMTSSLSSISAGVPRRCCTMGAGGGRVLLLLLLWMLRLLWWRWWWWWWLWLWLREERRAKSEEKKYNCKNKLQGDHATISCKVISSPHFSSSPTPQANRVNRSVASLPRHLAKERCTYFCHTALISRVNRSLFSRSSSCKTS